MCKIAACFCAMLLLSSVVAMATGDYRGDERCQPPRDWQGYSPPYDPLEHPGEFPTFPGADQPGWSCSYQRQDGTIVQYGDSRSPQEQWLAVYGNPDNEN